MAYFPKLGLWLYAELWFIALCSVFAALYVSDASDLSHFLLCTVFTSFRISGTYALPTNVNVSFHDNTRDLLGFAFVMAVWNPQLEWIVG